MKYLPFYFTCILFAIISCSPDTSEDFPLLGAWSGKLIINSKIPDNIKTDTFDINVEFTENGHIFYEQGRILDTLDYTYQSDLQLLKITGLGTAMPQEVQYIKEMKIISFDAQFANCQTGIGSNYHTIWDLIKK
ncbi:MAG: hypothetical protein KBF35_03875 [Saprospiraceae bacterium]|nr:hypothetical protein [Saprospiraceae bacterium]